MKGGEEGGPPHAGGAATDPYEADGPEESFVAEPSLLDEIEGLIEDGKNYLDAELGFQKNRAAFAASQIKTILIASLVALVLFFVAVLALSVGLIIALTPHLTALGATALVAGSLLLVVGLLIILAINNWQGLLAAFQPSEPEE